jgi:hypothetical protein
LARGGGIRTSFHEHFSFPSDAKTGKALMLEPAGK